MSVALINDKQTFKEAEDGHPLVDQDQGTRHEVGSRPEMEPGDFNLHFVVYRLPNLVYFSCIHPSNQARTSKRYSYFICLYQRCLLAHVLGQQK